MTPLHAPAALRTAAELDVEAAHDGVDRGQLFLMLRVDAAHFNAAAAVGTRPWHRRPVSLVDLRRAASRPLPAVLRPVPSAGLLAGAFRPVHGEGRSLPFAGAPGLIELFLEVFATPLPPVSTADGAVPGRGWCAPTRRSASRSPAEATRPACPSNPALAGAPPNRRARRSPWPCSTYRHLRPDAAPHFPDFLDFCPLTQRRLVLLTHDA